MISCHFILLSVTTLTVFTLNLVSSPCTAFSSELRQGSPKRSDSHNRFKSLDRILNRLDGGVPSATAKKTDLRSSSSQIGFNESPKERDTFSKSDLKEPMDFSKAYDDDDLKDNDDDLYDEDDTTDNSDLLADRDSHLSRWSHSYKTHYLATKTTTTTTPPPRIPQISYSQFKWKNLGTRQGVEQYRRNSMSSVSNSGYGANNNSHTHTNQVQRHHHNSRHHQIGNGRSESQPLTPDTAVREAISHALRVSKEGGCNVPKPRLVRVHDFYPHPGKTYVPHCTILHQCSDDTGCCRHDVLSCSPKTTQRVELSFYTLTMDSSRGSSVERLVFYNHTECECRDKMEEMMPRDSTSLSPSYSSPMSAGTITNHVLNPYSTNNGTSSSSSSSVDAISTPPRRHHAHHTAHLHENSKNKNLQCKCPSAYTERISSDGSCSCDCFDKQIDCLRLKRGKDFLSMQDKWCVQSGRCEMPDCAYGSYIHLAGRCPRKKERNSQSLSWHRYLIH